MVGDTPDDDILAAQRLGLRSVWLRRAGAARQEGAAPAGPEGAPAIVPDAIVDGLEELPAALGSLARGSG